ncbi:sulfur relay protein TusB/DsrH [Burkholderiales bacterium JOSHI_001]|nr:sulfur relay protein TusB/DsrH [Burkholderiales bacterium JOSHI_001]
MLHIVNKSPAERTSLASCLRVAQDGQALLLIEDGVYAAIGSVLVQATQRLKVYALAPDLKARGLSDRAAPGITLIDYAGFVDLVAEHATSQSWL